MSTYLVQPDLSILPSDLPESPLPYPLDPFQQYALKAIHLNHHVLVCAKTGSGKTAVGELGIYKALKEGKRIIYTTPIKSLSNQKFSDLKKQFDGTTVGLMTGDVQELPSAQILVMTTEILRNLLCKQGTKTQALGLTASLTLDNLGLVIFDECHYINDPSRGKIWEETMIRMPDGIQCILLSATLNRPDLFANWLGSLKKVPVHLIQTQYRIVPLTHTILHPVTDEFQTILTPSSVGTIGVVSGTTNNASNSATSGRIIGELFQDKVYRDYLDAVKGIQKGHEVFKQKVQNKVVMGEKGAVEGKVRPKTYQHQLNHCLDLLKQRSLLPALVFVFSRKGCEDFAHKITHSFLDSSEAADVEHIISFHLHSFKSLEALPQFHELKSLLTKGIAFHHSGLLPILKEIIEILFGKGLVKVLFATETFAVGLNMPTKTVIFSGLKKYDDQANGMRYLRTDEYTQMAGRAGRRGKDKEGLVIYLPDREPATPFELQQIMKGGMPPVTSRMDFHYDFLLKTLHANNTGWLQLMEQSYWFQQRLIHVARADKAIADLEAKQTKLEACLSEEQILRCKERLLLEDAVKTASGNRYKKAQQELSKWRSLNDSPSLIAAFLNYDSLQDVHRSLIEERAAAAGLRNHADEIAQPVAFLKAAGYLKESETPLPALTSDDLTLRGILATEINEGQPILMTELFLSRRAHALAPESLAALLSVFLEDFEKEVYLKPSDLDVPAEILPVLEFLNDEATRLGDLEYKCGAAISDTAWNLSLQWTEAIYRWITDPDVQIGTLCRDYGVFEGNFVRGLLKLANLLDEWQSVATYCEHADQIEKITALKPRLIRDLVVPKSLYMKL